MLGAEAPFLQALNYIVSLILYVRCLFAMILPAQFFCPPSSKPGILPHECLGAGDTYR